MSRTPSTRGLVAVVICGAGALGIGWLITRHPEFLLETAPDLVTVIETIDPALALLVLAGVLVVLAPMLGLLGRIHADPPQSLREKTDDGDSRTRGPSRRNPPFPLDRRSSTRERPVVGGDLEQAIARATAYQDASPEDRAAARNALVDALRPVAVTAYARERGVDEKAALEAVVAGTWTDDQRARAFLADEDGHSTPLSLWLYDLVTAADPFRRSLERTVEAIDTLQSNPNSLDTEGSSS